MEKSTRIAGVIRTGMVSDMMQLLSRSADATGVLTLDSGDGRGEIWFRGGELVRAQFGAWTDENAILRLIRLPEGYFAFMNRKQTPRRTIQGSVESILLNCFRRIDEGESEFPPPPEPSPAFIEPAIATTLAPEPEHTPHRIRDLRRAAWFEPTKHMLAVSLLFILLGVEALVITRSVNPIVAAKTAVSAPTSATRPITAGVSM